MTLVEFGLKDTQSNSLDLVSLIQGGGGGWDG